jgi:hypothetical protein
MTPIRKFKGIKDLLDHQRFRIGHLQNELIKQDIPGSNWSSYMNVYNLVHGCYPNDAYTFIFLSEFLNLDIKIIINRYSDKQESKIETVKNITDLKFNDQWDVILEVINKDKNIINQLTPYELSWQLIKNQLKKNRMKEHNPLLNKLEIIKEIIDVCINNGMIGNTIPQATAFKQLDQVTKLLSEGHEINELDFGQRTGLMVAALMNDIELVKFHVDKGAFTSFSDQDDFQACDLTTSKEIVDYLKTDNVPDLLENPNEIENDQNENPNNFFNNSTVESKEIRSEVKFDSENVDSFTSIIAPINLRILLSVRAFNCCRRANLNDVNDIINYYRKNKSFMNINNCGFKVELELIEIVKRFTSNSLF